jgi:phosphoribosyl 1,2-cyclic phosphodiesterase
MKVTFYGTRGTMPVADPNYTQFGGNTACILVTFSTGRIAILDAGTGIRKLGNDLLNSSHEQFGNISIILSHTHWDHIQGFPYFEPAYDPRRNFTISICGKARMGKDLESLFSTQMQNDFFPVSLEEMGAKFTFLQPDYTTYEHPSGIKLEASKHNHRGDAYGYRIEEDGKTLVYCTDVEHKNGIDPNVVALAKNADLLIHDAQYTPDELKIKRGWGHSSWEQAIEVAERAGVKKLALFHHDPEHDDTFLSNMEIECRKRFADLFLAREGDEKAL